MGDVGGLPLRLAGVQLESSRSVPERGCPGGVSVILSPPPMEKVGVDAWDSERGSRDPLRRGVAPSGNKEGALVEAEVRRPVEGWAP